MSTGIVQEESGMPVQAAGAPHEDAPAVLDNMDAPPKESPPEPKEPLAAEKEAAAAAAAAKKAATTIKIPSIMASSVSLSPKDPSGSNAASVESVTKAQAVAPPVVEDPAVPVLSPTANPTGGSSIIIPPLANPIYSTMPAQPSVPSVPTNQNSAPTSAKAGPAHPQLNDALAYLDRVKAEFHDQPDIYNKFLQIMRDFKINAYTTILDAIFSNSLFSTVGLIPMGLSTDWCTCSWDIRA